MLIITTLLLAGAVIFVLMECSNTANADPTIAGPPTIYEHVAGINASMQFFKYVAGILAGMFTFILGLLGYIWRITVANIKSSIRHVEENLKEDIDENKDEIKDIKKNFMSIESHKMICGK